MHEQVIGVDVDGVVADLLQVWLDMYNTLYDDHLVKADITHYDLHRIVKPIARGAIYDLIADPTFYDHVRPLPDAAWAISTLRDAGWKVVFISHCFKHCFDQKLEWLARYTFLPFAWEIGVRPNPDFIGARDKRLVNVPILVDDHMETVKEFVETGRRGFLFHSNRHPDAYTWPEIVHDLLGIDFTGRGDR